MTTNIKISAKENQHNLDILIRSIKHTINSIRKPDKHFAGIYVISDRNNDTIIYVGETSDMARRMNDHLHGTSSFSKKSKIKTNELNLCNIRYRRMKDDRERKLFESYVIGVLKPKFNY